MSLVLGLDLSLTSPALAFQEDGHFVAVANTKTTGKMQASLKNRNGASTHDRRQRLLGLAEWVADFWMDSMGDIDLAVIEAPAVGSKMGHMHDRSGLWWLVVNALRATDVPVVEVSPAGRAKYITGSGRSDKAVVLAHARHHWSDDLREHARQDIKNDDIADAMGLADMGGRRLGFPVIDLPVDNLAAMDGVLWPVT